MSDLTGVNDTLPVRVGGVSSSSGLPDFYADVTSLGQLLVKDAADGPVTPGTAASVSTLIGGQYNSTLPTLTNTQQASIQLDSSGRIIVRNSEFPATVDTNYGTVGASTIRTASQVGNATGAADFNAGATGAQTLRVSANQGSPGTAANAWFEKITDGTNTAAVKAASTAAVAADPALVVAISPNNTVAVTQSTSPWIVKDVSDGSVTGGTAGTFSLLTGGVYNTTLPTLTTGQQASLQLTSNGALIVDDTSQNTIATGTLGALGARVSVSTAGQSSAAMQLYAGTLIGTIVPNVSYDNGVTWQATYWQNSATGELFGNFTFASANPAEGQFIVVPPGSTNVSVVVTAYTSGTANVVVSATNITGKSTLFDGISGTPPPPTVVQVGGLVATTAPSLVTGNMQTLSMTLAGAVRVDGSGVTQPTKDSADGPVTPGAVAANSILIGGQYNTTLPTLTNTEQSAIQLDSSGRVLVTQNPITKGTQGANGVTTQDLKDSGRNVTNYFMAAQVVSTATETLQSLTGYKSGAAVAATTTPAVVTAGKIYRIQRIIITYIAITTAGTIQVNLRANLSGTVAVTSPLVDSWNVGANAATAGVAETIVINIPDGMEFAAGTGLGITVQGFGATGSAAAVGYAKISMSGYEY